jgi:hypothetical protein
LRFPGPGTYTNKDIKWKKDIQTTIKSRHSAFIDDDLKKHNHSASPQSYLLKFKLQESKRFSGISFGKGYKFNDIRSNIILFILIFF